jgi:hypothetical protein
MNGADRRLVFGIGLNKTGTSSLDKALKILGYRSLHWGGPETRALVQRAIAEDKPLLHYLDPRIDAFSDVGTITNHFELADRQYPGSRFILTVRDIDAWVDSRRRHVEKNRERKASGAYHGTFLEIDVEAWAAQYRAHEARVRAHFVGRADDLLTLDITGGDGWGRLCAFLGHPVPDTPFPSENRYKPWSSPAARP